MRPLAVALAAVVLLGASAAEAGDSVLRGARVVTVSDAELEQGDVLVVDGKIAAVGKAGTLEVPTTAEELDLSGKWLLPSFVHPATRLGLRSGGEGGEGTFEPARTPEDELNPWLAPNRWTAANGFTTLGLLPGPGSVGGTAWVVRSAGDDPESMVRRKDALLRSDVTVGARYLSLLGGNLAKARKELDEHAKWERDHADWERAKAEAEKAKKKPPTEPKKPSPSKALESLRNVLEGKTALLAIVSSSADVRTLAEALSDERVRGDRMRLYTLVSGSAPRAVDVLLDLGATCVVRTSVETWPGSRDLFLLADHLRRAGLPVLLAPASDSRSALRTFPTQLALLVRSGFPRDAALRACTLGNAELLGVEGEVGSIQKGRRADLLEFSGDPLLPTSRLLRVWIDGELVEGTP